MAKKKRRKKKKNNAVPVVILLIIALALAGVVASKMDKKRPSDKMVDDASYFGVESDNEVAVITSDAVCPEKAVSKGGHYYLSYDAIVTYITDKIYYDPAADILTMTTPNEIINVGSDANVYYLENGQLFISLQYVCKRSDVEVKSFENPARIVIKNRFDLRTAEVAKEDVIRMDTDVRSDIVKRAEPGEVVYVHDDNDAMAKVSTEDGYIGFIQRDSLGERKEPKAHNSAIGEYTSIGLGEPINMAFHQIFTSAANDTLNDVMKNVSGVNVIAPTWFFLDDYDGTTSNLSSASYVDKAHARGLKVFAVANDFDGDLSSYSDTLAVLSSTQSRQNLAKGLVEKTKACGADGLNIDFEKVNEECKDAYITFIRELSVLCRNEGIILSVDTYVPQAYNLFLDRAGQAEVCDYVLIMAYDEHYAGSDQAGSVSSISWVRAAVEETLKEVPKEKIIIAIPFYTRLWEVDIDDRVTSTAMGMYEAEQYVKEHSMKTEWGDEVKQNIATLDGPMKYFIWLEDAKSIEEKMKVIKEGEVAGVAEWKLGFEDPEVWEVIDRYI